MILRPPRSNPSSTLCSSFFFFNDTATTEIYTFPYTTLFRSQLPFTHFDQTIVEHRIKEYRRILSLLRPQLDFEASHERKDLFAQPAVLLRKQMAAKSGKFSLSHSAFIHRKRLFVLMKASWRFGNRAHSETEQHTRSRPAVTLKAAPQSSLALSSGPAILRQPQVAHSHLDVTRAPPPLPPHPLQTA